MIIFTPTVKKWAFIILTFLMGVFLMFLPLPSELRWLSTVWLVLILLFWVLTKPQLVNVWIAWLVGILIDVIYNVTIGMHALGLVLIVFFMLKIREKILHLSLLKTTPIIFVLLVVYQALIFFMQSYVGGGFSVWSILSGAILGTLIWPLLAWLLFNYQRKFCF